jgi:mycobactin peptide synthetase MbtE
MSDSRSVPALDETERKLLAIWRDVLENPDVDLNDSFLDLGGDSLSAMMCTSRIEKTFGVEIAIEYFFMDDGTVSTLATLINQHRAK